MTVELTTERGQSRLVAMLDPGEFAFVDADALTDADGPVPAVLISADTIESATEIAAAAAGYLAEEIERIVGSRNGSIEIVGDGVVATLVRQRLGGRLDQSGEPATYVVTTSDPGALVGVLERAGDSSLVVLAASTPPTVPIDVYGTIHRKGQTLVGLRPFGGGTARGGTDNPDVPSPVSTVSGELLSPSAGARWYVVRAA